jgi:hypothetical protein
MNMLLNVWDRYIGYAMQGVIESFAFMRGVLDGIGYMTQALEQRG